MSKKNVIYKITVTNFNHYNGHIKRGHKSTLISNNFCDDAKLRVLPVSVRWMFLGIILTCGDHTRDTVEMTESMLRDLLESSWSIARALDALQSFQLLSYTKNESLLNRIEIKGIEKKDTSTEPEPERQAAPLQPKAASPPKEHPLLEIWNTNCGNLPKARGLSQKRLKAAKARFAENPDPEYWVRVVKIISASDWCNARHEKNKTWRASIDYLLQPDTHLKALEGALSGGSNQEQRSMLHRI